MTETFSKRYAADHLRTLDDARLYLQACAEEDAGVGVQLRITAWLITGPKGTAQPPAVAEMGRRSTDIPKLALDTLRKETAAVADSQGATIKSRGLLTLGSSAIQAFLGHTGKHAADSARHRRSNNVQTNPE